MKNTKQLLLIILVSVIASCSESLATLTPPSYNVTEEVRPVITHDTPDVEQQHITETPTVASTSNLIEQLPDGLYVTYIRKRSTSGMDDK